MARSALLTLLLSAIAILVYLGYRALDLIPLSAVSQPAPVAADAEPVERLPEFALANVDGELQSIRSWPNKALIINFWATWCAPCLREIPLLNEYQETYRDRSLQVVGIAIDRTEPVLEFMDNLAFDYPVLIGQADAMDAAAAFGVEFFGLPFSVFTDSDGYVLGVHTGELHAADLDNLVTTLDDLATGSIDVAGARARLAGRR